jgi:hypothetical protein
MEDLRFDSTEQSIAIAETCVYAIWITLVAPVWRALSTRQSDGRPNWCATGRFRKALDADLDVWFEQGIDTPGLVLAG